MGLEVLRRLPGGRWNRIMSHDRIISRDKQICIDGFPRCANTTTTVAFRYWNPDVAIAHHVHAPYQLIQAVKWGIPAAVLIREPAAAVTSALINDPRLEPALVLRAYTSFYDKLGSWVDDMVIGLFDDVVKDPGAVIRAINTRYGTDFVTRPWSEAEVAAVFSRTGNNPVARAEKTRGKKEGGREKVRAEPGFRPAVAAFERLANHPNARWPA